MRKCLRCGAIMEENYRLRFQKTGSNAEIMPGNSLFSKRVATPKIAICFSCGEVSLYIDLLKQEKTSYSIAHKKNIATVGGTLQTSSDTTEDLLNSFDK